MAQNTRSAASLIPILIAVIIAIGVGGYLAGWWDPFGLGQGETCLDPDGCQCGILPGGCPQGATCERNGPFGQCRMP